MVKRYPGLQSSQDVEDDTSISAHAADRYSIYYKDSEYLIKEC
jgi:hypothetical protein